MNKKSYWSVNNLMLAVVIYAFKGSFTQAVTYT